MSTLVVVVLVSIGVFVVGVLLAVAFGRAAARGDAVAGCVCGHGLDAHEHYRPGSDCGLCGCERYRGA